MAEPDAESQNSTVSIKSDLAQRQDGFVIDCLALALVFCMKIGIDLYSESRSHDTAAEPCQKPMLRAVMLLREEITPSWVKDLRKPLKYPELPDKETRTPDL